MVDFETQLISLEIQWREVDDLLRAARAELALNQAGPSALITAIRKRMERTERAKQEIMTRILALEDSLGALG